MTSTASPSLKLELMGTGDQSGTWGVTTNTNLGTLLEQAITGYLGVAKADATDYTLTNTDYAVNETRNMVIEFTGSPGGAFNVITPAAEKVWLFKNSTDQTMTVKVSGQTGVAVVAGTSRWLYSNGTDVKDGLGFIFSSTASALSPLTNDGQSLGTTSLKWSDLFLAAGGVVNFNSGDVTITHGTNALYFAGASTGYRFDALVYPASDGGAALGTGTAAFSDLFLASTGVISFANDDVTITHATNALAFAGASNGYTFDAVVKPSANGGAALGAAGTAFSDLFLAAGGVINWDSGDVTITEGTNTLTFAGASSGYTFSDGGIVVGAATGGSQGVGTVNATAIYVNGALVGTGSSTTYDVASSPVAWVKPSSGTFIRIQMWGGGASGGTYKSAGETGGGGGGGAYFEQILPLSAIASTATITIGAGGAARTVQANGDPGGNTTFVHGATTYTAFGGGGGYYRYGGGGGGGGLLSAGGTAASSTGAAGGSGNGGSGGTGASAVSGTAGEEAIYGGGGGGGAGDPNGGAGGISIYGGGGGGGAAETTTPGAGGSSVYGGAGGAGATSTNNATAGSVPGGGGGGAEAGNSGAGGAGRVIISIW